MFETVAMFGTVVVNGRTLARGAALAVAIGLVAAPGVVYGDGKHGRGAANRGDGVDYDYARVVDVQPLVTRVRVAVPQRECWDETRYEDPAPRGGVAGPMILGGLVGGALGSQVGSGNGRRAATVAGAVIGSALGHDAGERSRDRYYTPDRRAYTVEQCDTRYETRYDERVDGYDVTYEYHGRRFQARLPYDPGERLRVRVAVEPAER